MTERAQSNLWRATSRNDLSTPALAAGKHYDAIVIGGGFTGINCALKLAEENLTVALFDAEHIGYGGSGRNVGLVNGGLWMEPDKVETALGTAAGKKLNALLGAGPELVFTLIDTHRIDCDPIRNGTLHCAHSQAGLRQLESRLRQHKQRGVKVELISSDETAVKVGTDLYHGALHYQDVGTIQPLAYLLGLARVAETKGVQIHQHSPVSSMTYQGNKWCVQTGDASVYSDAVIVATNAYLNRLVLPQKTSLTPIHYFQAATAPLPKEALQSILPERQGCWDTAMVMSSIRLDQAGRLIIGSVGSLGPIANTAHIRWAHHKRNRLFPALGEVEFEYQWHGRIAYTADHLPKIVGLGPNAISLNGYNGRGISPGTVFGRAAADYVMSGNTDSLPIPVLSEYRESFTRLKRAYYEFGVTAIHSLESLV